VIIDVNGVPASVNKRQVPAIFWLFSDARNSVAGTIARRYFTERKYFTDVD